MLKGAPASAGIGIGQALLVQTGDIVIDRRIANDTQQEKTRFFNAVEQFCEEVQIAAQAIKRKVVGDESGILAFQGSVVRDPELTEEVLALIEAESLSAEHAFDVVCERYIELFRELDDELFRARASDFRDIKIRMLSILMEIQHQDLYNIPENTILIAEDLTPSQAALMDHTKVSAIVTQIGTRFSHIATIARALHIPTVVGVKDACSLLAQGDQLIVDGVQGKVLINPPDDQLALYDERREEERIYLNRLQQMRDRVTQTADGKRIYLMANLAIREELHLIAENKVDGVGLFRTEYLYMNSRSLPDEEMQFATYRRLLLALNGKPVIIRTLDIGGDKWVPYLGRRKEDNPSLGERGVRFCLRHPDLFRTQLAALLRASIFGDLHILIPMISSVTELYQIKALLAEVQEDLTHRGLPFKKEIPLGVMIETPSAAICADTLAKEADFFSIGTNDLTQYTLAVDRGDNSTVDFYSPLHPAILRLMKSAVDGASSAGIPISVCGGLSAEELMLPLLLGMGVDAFSVSSEIFLRTRSNIADIDAAQWSTRVEEVLQFSTPQQVEQYIRDALAETFFLS